MDFEQTLETQRLKLLRIVAGLFGVMGFLSVGPVSRGFSGWVCGFVGSILSRAESAARYLVIAHAASMIARSGMEIDRARFSELLVCAFVSNEADASVSDCRERLKALRAVLMDLPRYAARLIRRAQKQAQRSGRLDRPSFRMDRSLCICPCVWNLAKIRIERPPDKSHPATRAIQPPPEFRAGGVCS